jgi:hypothetical protein
MEAQAQDVVHWVVLVVVTAMGAVLAEVAQQRWWARAR